MRQMRSHPTTEKENKKKETNKQKETKTHIPVSNTESTFSDESIRSLAFPKNLSMLK